MTGNSLQTYTEKELKRMKRAELLELVNEQSREIDRLQEELDSVKQQLEERQIILSRAGSIADAALQLSGVFEAAQKAADDYLYSIRAAAKRSRVPRKEHREEEDGHSAGHRAAQRYESREEYAQEAPARHRPDEPAAHKADAPARRRPDAPEMNSTPKRASRKETSARPKAQSERTDNVSRKNAYDSMNTAEIPSGLGQLSTNGTDTGAIGSVADYTDSFTFGGEKLTDSYSYTNGRYSSDN